LLSPLFLLACADSPEAGGQDAGIADQSINTVVDAKPADSPQPSPDQAAADAAPGGCSASSLAPGTHDVTLDHGGVQRHYTLFIPSGYTPQNAAPLMLSLHGLGGDPKTHASVYNIDAAAGPRGYFVAYPAGIQRSWNAGSCCPPSMLQNIDDVGFVRAVVADVSQKVCVDPKRVYASGKSNGAFMTFRLACEAADLFAAVAPVAGSLRMDPCTPSRPVPVMMFNGIADPLVKYTDAEKSFADWSKLAGCSDTATTQTYKKGDVTCETYNQCSQGVEVTLCGVVGGGHCWPGEPCGMGPTTDISANQAMMDFFDRFTL
jgi:polyhydroxybutyrate depolymerase